MWLQALPVSEAATKFAESKAPPMTPRSASEWEMATRKYILSQYRQYEMLEHSLHRPIYFIQHAIMYGALPFAIKMRMLELYYAIDDGIVLGLLLGRRFGSRSRKDLDELCAKNNVTLGSCKRQVDNLKRILKRVEDMPGRLELNIRQEYALPDALASRYAYILFLNVNRIDISKKKLAQYTLADFEYCASVVMQQWCHLPADTCEELDDTFAANIRDIKQALSTNKDALEEYRAKVTNSLAAGHFSTATEERQSSSNLPFRFNNIMSLIDPLTASSNALNNGTASNDNFYSLFKTVLRSTMSIGAGLGFHKEVRKLILNIVEKIVEPFVAGGWRAVDMDMFFQTVVQEWSKLTSIPDTLTSDHQTEQSWKRLINGVRLVALRLYPR